MGSHLSDPAVLDALSRRAAAGEDVKNLLPMAFNQKERFEIADKIRDDAKPTIEGWNKTRTQFNQLESLAKRGWSDQGAGQVASLYSFIKALDPESVVREGEVALARSAESLINQFLAKYERAGRHDTERDKGVRAWDIERQAQSQSGDGSGAESANTKYGAYFCATLSPAEVTLDSTLQILC